MAKFKIGKYKCGSFCGGTNNSFILIMFEGEVVITLINQSNILYWHHKYTLHTGLDKTEAIIHQHL